MLFLCSPSLLTSDSARSVSRATLCPGFTFSIQYSGRPPKSRGQSGLKLRSFTIWRASTRKKTKEYLYGSGGEQSEAVPLKEVPFADSSLHPMQHLLPLSWAPSHESKQHMVRSLGMAGTR